MPIVVRSMRILSRGRIQPAAVHHVRELRGEERLEEPVAHHGVEGDEEEPLGDENGERANDEILKGPDQGCERPQVPPAAVHAAEPEGEAEELAGEGRLHHEPVHRVDNLRSPVSPPGRVLAESRAPKADPLAHVVNQPVQHVPVYLALREQDQQSPADGEDQALDHVLHAHPAQLVPSLLPNQPEHAQELRQQLQNVPDREHHVVQVTAQAYVVPGHCTPEE